MRSHRYSAESVECVQDGSAREFLVAAGLPIVPGIFAPAEPAGQPGNGVAGSDRRLRLGSGSEEEGSYFLDCDTGVVRYIESYEHTEFFVNSSPRSFATCLSLFQRETGRLAADADMDECEAAAASLSSAIEAIDAPALSDDSGYWRSLLFDVANGDYAGDDEPAD